MTIKANALIDTLSATYDDIATGRRAIPRGSFIGENSPYLEYYRRQEAAERQQRIISDVTGIGWTDLDNIYRTARKWYERYDWRRCLPDDVAERLVAFYAE